MEKRVELFHLNPTFDLCEKLEKEDLLFYFFRKWTQTLADNPEDYSERAKLLKGALERNKNLSDEDKERLLTQLNNSYGKFADTYRNYGKGLNLRREKLFGED
jgi:hypothetical protein